MLNPLHRLPPLRACPDTWRGVVGGTTTGWPSDSVTVTDSQMMSRTVAARPYSIGYVESGQGLGAGEPVTAPARLFCGGAWVASTGQHLWL